MESSYNKVETLPFFGNTIVGFDKFGFDFPEEQVPKIQLEDEGIFSVEGEIKSVRGRKGKIQVVKKNGYVNFLLNPAIYLYDNNFYTVGYSEFIRMIEEIESELDFSIRKGVVRILHPQSTIHVDSKPINYFNVLGNSTYFHRSQEKTTLYYKTKGVKKNKLLMFYDKNRQAGILTPKEFNKNENLRFESQFYNISIKNIAKKLGKSRILIEDLIKPEVYQIFIEKWYQEYQNINKERQNIFKPERITKASDIYKGLIIEGLKSIGGMVEFEKILEATRPYLVNRRSDFFSKVKKTCRDLVKESEMTKESPHLLELNSKIELAYHNSITEIDQYCGEKSH